MLITNHSNNGVHRVQREKKRINHRIYINTKAKEGKEHTNFHL